MKYVSIPAKKSLAQRKNSSLPATSPVGRIHPKTDPDRGMFVKGTHERQFAYEAHTACDKHGIVLGVEVTAGNVSDSVAWDAAYDHKQRRETALPQRSQKLQRLSLQSCLRRK